jgi:hypothetical protein
MVIDLASAVVVAGVRVALAAGQARPPGWRISDSRGTSCRLM